MLEQKVREYYTSGYNCSETLLRACNDEYQLNMNDEDMKVMAGFGGGMFVGKTCGALVGSIAAVSKKIVETKAHDMPELKNIIQKVVLNFKKELGDTDCAKIKPIFHSKDDGCLHTCLHAAIALEKTLKEENII